MPKILMLNGPNLNLLGTREPEKYGHETLQDIERATQSYLEQHGIELECFQSNAEHELINKIHQTKNDGIDYLLFNPAAFTHTSVALRDAVLAVSIPFIEIHLTDPKSRETFRHHSFFSDIAEAVISGKGPNGYRLAAEKAVKRLTSSSSQ